MYRGTTPTLTLTIDSDLNFANIDKLWVTFKAGTREKTFTEDDVTIVSADKKINVQLTQEDTLYFGAGTVSVQIRVKMNNDMSYASNIKKIDVNAILKDGMI